MSFKREILTVVCASACLFLEDRDAQILLICHIFKPQMPNCIFSVAVCSSWSVCVEGFDCLCTANVSDSLAFPLLLFQSKRFYLLSQVLCVYPHTYNKCLNYLYLGFFFVLVVLVVQMLDIDSRGKFGF